MLHYLLQVVFFQLCFLLVYELLLKRETFFQTNRWYLILMPVLGFLLPFLEFAGLRSLVPAEGLLLLPEVILDTNSTSPSAAPTPDKAATGTNWWLVLYFLGFVVSFLLLIRKSLFLRQLYKGDRITTDVSSKVIIVPQSRLACTFLGTIFLGSQLNDQEKQQILSHELVHLRQRHSLDLLWYELLKIFFWFNPMIYLFQNRLSELHEFIADSHAVKSTGKRQYFEQLLNTAFQTKDISFINQFFNQSLIKKRILMLQKSNSKSFAKAKYLLLLPLLFAMLVIVSCSSDNEATIEPAVSETQSVDQGIEMSSTQKPDGIPFAVVEQVPVFPGCEDLATNEERRDCMTQKVTQQVNRTFNTNVAGDDITGINRIYVQFQVGKSGEVNVLGVRAPHKVLEEEAKRVVGDLPDMIPAQHEGEEVAILYSLPIVFNRVAQTEN